MTTRRTNIALWHYYVAIDDDTLTVLKRNNFKFRRKFFWRWFSKDLYIYFFKDLFGAISIVSITYRRDKIIFNIYGYSRNCIMWKNRKIKLMKNFFTIKWNKIIILFDHLDDSFHRKYSKIIYEIYSSKLIRWTFSFVIALNVTQPYVIHWDDV